MPFSRGIKQIFLVVVKGYNAVLPPLDVYRVMLLRNLLMSSVIVLSYFSFELDNKLPLNWKSLKYGSIDFR